MSRMLVHRRQHRIIDGTGRAVLLALAAAHTQLAAGFLVQVNVHRTALFALAAVDTLVRIDFISQQRDRIKQSVNRTERAQIAAERPVDHNAQKNHDGQNEEFPCGTA